MDFGCEAVSVRLGMRGLDFQFSIGRESVPSLDHALRTAACLLVLDPSTVSPPHCLSIGYTVR